MHIIYYVDGKRFVTKNYDDIPINQITSFDENTPALENLKTGFKVWCKKRYSYHRLTGPAKIFSDGTEKFCLNGYYYKTVKEWIVDHPNPDLYFDAIGVLTETDKILWFLQN
jgi:hypothetical protein